MMNENLTASGFISFALYGASSPTWTAQKAYEQALNWMKSVGHRPRKADGNLLGRSNGRYKLFAPFDRKLRKMDFSGLTNFSVFGVPSEISDDQILNSYETNCGVEYRSRDWMSFLVFFMPLQMGHKQCSPRFLEIAKDACEHFNPRYGIGYRRKSAWDAAGYGYGSGGEGDDEFDSNKTEWFTLCRAEVFTFLRNIYPWNFLTSTQLDLKVGNIRLTEWIEASSERGTLSPLTDTVTLWTVPDDRIVPVRDVLWKAGIVLDRKRDFEAVLDEYNVSQEEVAQHYKTGKPLVHQPRGPGLTEEQMLKTVLGTFGDENSRVLKVDESGKLRDVPEANVKKKANRKSPNK